MAEQMSHILNSHAEARSNPLFFGERGKGIIRQDIVTYPVLAKLDELMRSYHWRPTEVSMQGVRESYQRASEVDQFVFRSNLSRQIMLDTAQERAPALVFLPHCTNPEFEHGILAWSYFESIHSASYTHTLRAVFEDPSPVFDEVPKIAPIMSAGMSIAKYYDDAIRTPTMATLLLALMASNALEGIRFFPSFACTFSMGERGVLVPPAEVVRLIAQDEQVHLNFVRAVLRILRQHPAWNAEFIRLMPEFRQIMHVAAEEEKTWNGYLMQHGSIPGINEELLNQYVDYRRDSCSYYVGLTEQHPAKSSNPFTWMDSKWLGTGEVQVANQEVENTNYTQGTLVLESDPNARRARLSSFSRKH
jgi:ribonucleoside-diphosphate reductase beta chain